MRFGTWAPHQKATKGTDGIFETLFGS